MWNRNTSPRDELERRLIWIFGSPRSGSTWLMALLGDCGRVDCLNEPLIGTHLAPFMPEIQTSEPTTWPEDQRGRSEYLFSDEHAAVWRPLVRDLILGRLAVHAKPRRPLVVKEPNGSQAADRIMSVLPESRMLFLLRDGRDVIDSEVTSLEPGSWRNQDAAIQAPRRELIEHAAWAWRIRTEAVQRAFEAHDESRRMMIVYRDLLSDTAGWLERIYRWCGLPVDADAIRATVDLYAFEAVPDPGPKMFVRAATPGLWRERFDSAEIALIDSIIGEKLRELGFDPS
jgi:Sulfotransferase family